MRRAGRVLAWAGRRSGHGPSNGRTIAKGRPEPEGRWGLQRLLAVCSPTPKPLPRHRSPRRKPGSSPRRGMRWARAGNGGASQCARPVSTSWVRGLARAQGFHLDPDFRRGERCCWVGQLKHATQAPSSPASIAHPVPRSEGRNHHICQRAALPFWWPDGCVSEIHPRPKARLSPVSLHSAETDARLPAPGVYLYLPARGHEGPCKTSLSRCWGEAMGRKGARASAV